MSRTLLAFSAVLALAAIGRPAHAAELKVLEPADRSIVKGAIQFRLQPQHEKGERIIASPDVALQDESGNELTQIRALRDPATGICTAPLDTRHYPDGLYLVRIKYRALLGSKTVDTQEELSLSFRNTKIRPVKFTVTREDRPYKLDEPCEVTVRVTDARGKPMAGARVTFKLDKGDAGNGAEITDSDGEVIVNMKGMDPADAVLTVTVEDLAPVTRTIKFVE